MSRVPPGAQDRVGRDPHAAGRLAAPDLRPEALREDRVVALEGGRGDHRVAGGDDAVSPGSGHSDDEVVAHVPRSPSRPQRIAPSPRAANRGAISGASSSCGGSARRSRGRRARGAAGSGRAAPCAPRDTCAPRSCAGRASSGPGGRSARAARRRPAPARGPIRGRLREAEELLELHRRDDRAVLAVVERRRAAAGQGEPLGGQAIEPLPACRASSHRSGSSSDGRLVRPRHAARIAACRSASSPARAQAPPQPLRLFPEPAPLEGLRQQRGGGRRIRQAPAARPGAAGRTSPGRRPGPSRRPRRGGARPRSARPRATRAPRGSRSSRSAPKPPRPRPPVTSSATSSSPSRTPLSRPRSAPAPELRTSRDEPGSRRRATRSGKAGEQRPEQPLVPCHSEGRRSGCVPRNPPAWGSLSARAGRSASGWRQPLQLARGRAHARRRLAQAVRRRQHVGVGRRRVARTPPVAIPRQGRRKRRPPAPRPRPRAARARGAGGAAGGAWPRPSRREASARRPPPAARAGACAAASLSARRRLEPLEPRGSPPHASTSSERPGEVHALDLRLAAGAQAVALVPEPQHAARPRPPRPPRALLGRVRRDALQLEPVEPPRRVVAQHLVLARVDHVRHALDGERGLGHVRREDHLALVARREREVLLLGRERPVQRQDPRAGRRPPSSACARRISGAPGQEAEHVPAGPRERPSRTASASVSPRLVAHLDRVRPARHVDHRAVVEEARDRARRRASRTSRAAAGRRARATPAGRRPARGRRAGCARGTRRARSCGSRGAAGPTAAGAVRTPSVATSRRVSRPKRRSKRTCQPTSRAERPALLVGDPPRDRARGDPPRLEQEDRAVGDQRRRHPRRLARARRRDEHGGPRAREGGARTAPT